MTPDEVAALRGYWDGVAFWNKLEPPITDLPIWVGEDIQDEGDSLVLRFREQGSTELRGIRLPNEPFPTPGYAFVGENIETPEDWYLDRRIALGEELDTGLLRRCDRVRHEGWTELVVDRGVWTWEPLEAPAATSGRRWWRWLPFGRRRIGGHLE